MIALASLIHKLLRYSSLIEVLTIMVLHSSDSIEMTSLLLHFVILELMHSLHKIGLLHGVLDSLGGFLFFLSQFDDSSFDFNLLLGCDFVLIDGLHHVIGWLNLKSTQSSLQVMIWTG